jgi:signal transduction histidine kinase
MVSDKRKTKAQLIAELEEMRQQRDVEKATKRVREAVLAMRRDEDLLQVAVTMYREMRRLGVETPGVSFLLIDEENQRCWWCVVGENPLQYGISATWHDLVEIDEELFALPYQEAPSFLSSDFLDRWRAGQVWTYEETEQEFRQRAEFLGVALPLPYRTGQMVTTVPFAHGAVRFREWTYSEEHVAIFQVLTQALSLGYLRFLDFHRVEEKNQALEEANQQIQENTRRKSDFLARMSHDLRTPMNAIVGYTRILLRRLRDTIEPRQLRNLENIDISAHNLLNLINEILDLSRVEAGRIEVQPQTVDLQQLAVECTAAIEPLIQAEVQLIQDIEAVPSLHTDGEILRKVLMNLLGNAVKFTDAGSITISVKSIEDQVEISVADTGMGIPSEDLPDIFEEFRQIERQGSTEKEGTGLGLAIARKSVELLGGTISAESEVGKGTTFTLRIKGYPSE